MCCSIKHLYPTCELYVLKNLRELKKELILLQYKINKIIIENMSVNKVILVGNVGKDPEIMYFDSGSVKATFTLATNERGYTLANGTQVPDRTEWHNVVCWKGLAQVVEKYVAKGSQLYIEGKIRSRTYDDQNGVKRYVTEINADNIEIIGRRSSQEEKAGYSPSNEKPVDQPTTNIQVNNSNDEADDLPF